MTEEEITRIETALEIRLPSVYRQLMVPFPIPCCAGNDETELWDNAERLIELNCELRKGMMFVKPWPKHMFALGVDNGGSTSALDLREEPPALWWADRCHLDGVGSGPTNLSFQSWAEDYLEGLKDDLEDAGIDPRGTPEAKKIHESKNAAIGCRNCIGCFVAAIILAFILGIVSSFVIELLK